MQEWEDPLASISISDFCSNWGTTSQPSDCRDSYTGYIQTLSCVCVCLVFGFFYGDLLSTLSSFSRPLTKLLSREENSPVGLRTRSFLRALIVTGDC